MKVVLQDLTKKFKSRDKKGKGEVVAVDHFTFEIPDGEAHRRKDLFWRR